MLRFSDLTPINLENEKTKFFAANCQYNPQFIYETNISEKELLQYGKPKWQYLLLAKRILRKYYKNKDEIQQKAEIKIFLDQHDLKKIIEKKLSVYNLNNEYKIVFSKNFISRCAINNKEKLVKIRLPITISQNEITAVINHEIDTHVIRQLNYERQSWFKQKEKNGFKPYLRTEEGLAAINELIANDCKLAYKTAANYLAIDLALKNDFVTVFNFFYEIWRNTERAWTWTFKKKRGIADTNQKGAFTKDLVYFEGFIQVLIYLKKHNCDPSELYYGKIDIVDIAKAKKTCIQKLVLPEIFTRNPEFYKSEVLKIIKTNLF
jgi:hypothetical protein